MTTTPSSRQHPAHALRRPTEREFLDALARSLGPEEAEAAWNRVCAFEGLRRPVIDMRDLQTGARGMLAVAEGRTKLTARCFVINTSNFLALTRGQA